MDKNLFELDMKVLTTTINNVDDVDSVIDKIEYYVKDIVVLELGLLYQKGWNCCVQYIPQNINKKTQTCKIKILITHWR